MQSIDTVVFDIGNVLLPWNPRWLFRKLLPDEAAVERFLTEVDFNTWNARHDAGQRFAEGIAQQAAAFPHYRWLFEAFFARWEETLADPDRMMLAILQGLRQASYRVLALTNFSAEMFPRARRMHPFLDEFDGVVVSGEVGMMKPDPAIYHLLCARYAVSPARAVFIDDSPPNVDGARQIGMHALHFVDANRLRLQLGELGVILG